MSEWISVKNGLPDKEGVYIGFIQYNSACSYVTPVRYIKQSFGEYWWWWIFEKSYTKFITHWMPLPEPPKNEDAEWVDNKCSACGKGIENLINSREWYENETPNYCPFCGAKFD